MPLIAIPAEDAVQRARGPWARWPKESGAQTERLAPIARPALQPTFRLAKSDPIFTIGSCFARNIEKQLQINGYNVAISQFRPPPEPRYRGSADTMLHRYLPQSIANELTWALEPSQPFPESSYVEVTPGRWVDLQLNTMALPEPFETVEARRRAILDYVKLAAQARLVIITVGLAEGWFDLESGLYLNAMPHPRARVAHPGRFEYHLLDYDEILAGLERIRSILAAHCPPGFRILITVSPVALGTTFTGADVLVANTYMKSALRTAVETFVRRHDGVDYFPSYESVILSDRSRAWRNDQAHVSDELVRVNVLRMLQAYAEDADAVASQVEALGAFDHLQAARDAAARRDLAAAESAFRSAVAIAPEDPQVLLAFGEFLIEAQRWTEAIKVLGVALEHGSAPYGGLVRLGQAQYGAGLFDAALETAVSALEDHSTSTKALHLAANSAYKLQDWPKALAFAERHLQADPDSESSRQRVARLREAVQRFEASSPKRTASGLGRLWRRRARPAG